VRFNSKDNYYLIGRKPLLSLVLKRIGQNQTFPRNINFGAFRGSFEVSPANKKGV